MFCGEKFEIKKRIFKCIEVFGKGHMLGGDEMRCERSTLASRHPSQGSCEEAGEESNTEKKQCGLQWVVVVVVVVVAERDYLLHLLAQRLT